MIVYQKFEGEIPVMKSEYPQSADILLRWTSRNSGNDGKSPVSCSPQNEYTQGFWARTIELQYSRQRKHHKTEQEVDAWRTAKDAKLIDK